jgi:hypothetical protein
VPSPFRSSRGASSGVWPPRGRCGLDAADIGAARAAVLCGCANDPQFAAALEERLVIRCSLTIRKAIALSMGCWRRADRVAVCVARQLDSARIDHNQLRAMPPDRLADPRTDDG